MPARRIGPTLPARPQSESVISQLDQSNPLHNLNVALTEEF